MTQQILIFLPTLQAQALILVEMLQLAKLNPPVALQLAK
jgi:hypothetical protein